jgi:predicted transcriptional regulator
METGPWVEHAQAIWNVLPVHPRPQPLESMTSYITRLAEANGLKSIHELGALAGGIRLKNLKSPDYPAPASPGLARLASVPTAGWLDMTFFHLVHRFGRSMHPVALHKFLAGSIAPALRYCPLCLAEHTPASYSLLWRFLVLPGCSEHAVHFLDQCGHCGSPLALLRCLPQLTTCPTCQGDLRSAVPSPLSSAVLESTNQYTTDLKMLLTPGLRPLAKDQAKLVGKRFQFLRRKLGLLIPEVASLMGREIAVVLRIDSVRKDKPACLDDYMRYADILGYSLCEIFDETALQDLLVPASEAQLLEQVEQAIHYLKARGKPLLPGNIGNLIGLIGRRGPQYPRANKLLTRGETEREQELLDSKLEEELVKLVEQTLKQGEVRGETIVLQDTCDLVGLTYEWMVKKYPRIKALFHAYQQNRSRRRRAPNVDEEEKVQQVQAAINVLVSQGEPVTLKRILHIVNLTYYQWRTSPRVKALLAQYVEKRPGGTA